MSRSEELNKFKQVFYCLKHQQEVIQLLKEQLLFCRIYRMSLQVIERIISFLFKN